MNGADRPEGAAAGVMHRWRRAAPIVALVALTAFSFHNGLQGGFVLDDGTLLDEMQCVQNPVESLKGLLLLGGGPCAYRPLRYLSYAADRALFGDTPFGYHLVNLLFHILAVVAVYFLAVRLMGKESGVRDPGSEVAPWFVAALFAIHPVQVDSVTYISGRRDVLSGLLFLGCVLSYLRYVDTRRRIWAVVIPPAFYLALQSKEMAITLPAVLIAIDALVLSSPACDGGSPGPQGRRGALERLARALWTPIRRHPILYVAVFGLAIAYFYGRGVAGAVTHHPGFWGGDRLANTATALGTLPKYVQLLAFPRTLMVDYSPDAYPIHTTLLAPLPLGGLGIAAALVAGVLVLARRAPLVALGAAWFGITMLPVMHVIPHHELLAEHYLYVPCIGIFLAAGAGVRGIERRRFAAAVAVAGLLVVPAALRTLVRNLDWRTPQSLWLSEMAVTDDCARAHYNYALLLVGPETAGADDLRRARRHFERALRIQAESKAGVSRIGGQNILAYLGSIAMRLGETERGLDLLRAAYTSEVRRRPGAESVHVLSQAAVALLNLGETGQDGPKRAMIREAIEVLDRWIAQRPPQARPWLMRGRARHILCDTTGARADYGAAIERGDAPEQTEAIELIVESFLEEGDPGAAGAAADAAYDAGARSERLLAYRRAIRTGDPPPPPRCPPPASRVPASHGR